MSVPTPPSKRDRLSAWLGAGRPRLADGAMGTMLHASGLPIGSCFDDLSRTRPELVIDVHLRYVRAGAEILETNAFGANPYKLAAHGLEDGLEEIVQAAVGLARQAVEPGQPVWIGGSLGPPRIRFAPSGSVR